MLKLADAIHEASAVCRNGQWLGEFLPWCLLTELLIAALRDAEETVEQLSETVVASDAKSRTDEHTCFVVHPAAVLGLTNFDTLHGLWQSMGRQLLTPYAGFGWVGVLLGSLSEYPIAPKSTRNPPNLDNELLRIFRS